MIKVEYLGQELDVPEWIEWIACDCAGVVFAYKNKPNLIHPVGPDYEVWDCEGEAIRIFEYELYEIPEDIEATLCNIDDLEKIEEKVTKPAHQIGGNHYEKYPIQPIEFYKSLACDKPDKYRGFLQFTAMKYLARYQDKNGIEDLEKASWYLNEIIKFETALEKE